MNIESVILIGLLIFFIYILFFRNYVLARKKFKCLRCGNCCKLRVALVKEEIDKIKRLGYKDFLDKKNYIKRINGYCKFLILKNGITACSIQSAKPEICKKFPFVKGFFGKKIDPRCDVFPGKLW